MTASLQQLSNTVRRAARRLWSRQKHVPISSEHFAAYQLLGLEPGADPRVVRQTFRRLAAAHHPDRTFGSTPREREARHRRFAELTAAYHALVA